MGLSFVACSEANDVPNNTIETTDSKATTLVLKGYESTASGFTIFQPEGYSSPFYIKDKQFYGSVYNFAEVGTKRLDEVSEDYESVSTWTETADIKPGCAYWAWCKGKELYCYAKFRVISIDGNNVTIEYVLVGTTNAPAPEPDPDSSGSRRPPPSSAAWQKRSALSCGIHQNLKTIPSRTMA